MKILIFSSHYPPDVAATGQLVAELAEDLVQAGDQLTVVTARPNYQGATAQAGAERGQPEKRSVFKSLSGRVFQESERRGVQLKVLSLPSFGRRGLWSRAIPFGAYAFGATGLAPFLEKPDLVYALSTPPLLGGLLGLGVARARRVPFVYHLQDVYPDIAVSLGVLNPEHRLQAALIRESQRVEGLIRQKADAVVVIGRDMQAQVQADREAPRETVLISNWADEEKIKPIPPESNSFRIKHGLQDRFVLGYSGNLGRAHGAELLPALAESLQDLQDLSLLVIGEGPSAKEIEREVARRGLKNLLRLPYQPKEQLSESLSAPDLHLVLQREETKALVVPSKLYGVLAAGRPVLAAAPKGSELARSVEELKVGLRVAPGNLNALEAAVRQLYADSKARQKMGQRARAAAEGRFSRGASSAQFHSLFHRLGGTS